MEVREVLLSDGLAQKLIALSGDWAEERNCWGYEKNGYEDLEGNRIFLAEEDGEVIGYLLGHQVTAEKTNSVMEAGIAYFEVEELYIKPAYRSMGMGSELFHYMEAHLEPELHYVLLAAAAKNYKAILHFYIEELGMEFWSAKLFKKLSNS